MKITKVSYERLDLDLSAPYTIAYETISKTTNFILKIETDLKAVGYGCAAPNETVTGGSVHGFFCRWWQHKSKMACPCGTCISFMFRVVFAPAHVHPNGLLVNPPSPG